MYEIGSSFWMKRSALFRRGATLRVGPSQRLQDLDLVASPSVPFQDRRPATRRVRACDTMARPRNGSTSGHFSRGLWMLDLLRKVYGGLRNVRNRIFLLDEAVGAFLSRCDVAC